MTEVPLFEGFDPPPVENEPTLGQDARRTKRQADAIARGVHPLGLVYPTVRLHPDAGRNASREDPRGLPLTCGSCAWRQVSRYHNKSYAKCAHPAGLSADQYAEKGPPRISHSAATDIRAWWPACVDYTPGDNGVSPDAARWIP